MIDTVDSSVKENKQHRRQVIDCAACVICQVKRSECNAADKGGTNILVQLICLLCVPCSLACVVCCAINVMHVHHLYYDDVAWIWKRSHESESMFAAGRLFALA
jgi:hypothetical protein